MQVIQTGQHASANLPDFVKLQAFVTVVPDQTEQAVAEKLEHHAQMLPVGASVLEMVDEADDAFGVLEVSVGSS